MTRQFRHSVTGRSVVVREGTRHERLVAGDKNYTEVKPEASAKAEPKSGGSRGTGSAGRRRGKAAASTDDG